ncbi:MAG: hypothetical protein ACAI43_26705 [Phycisphaerae bacterium]
MTSLTRWVTCWSVTPGGNSPRVIPYILIVWYVASFSTASDRSERFCSRSNHAL